MTQRLGAYAVVVKDGRILLTRISERGYPAGWWALPGGGVEHGEPPGRTVERELHEETGLTATSARLVAVHDVHTTSPGRGDAWEDYHGVHLLYAVTVEDTVAPHVVEVGGTTDDARWVDLSDAPGLGRLLPVVDHVLERIDDFV